MEVYKDLYNNSNIKYILIGNICYHNICDYLFILFIF